ncbi:hypothetical protein Vretimale_9498 [Volvox reticuliferus]|uniref:Cytochrome P450 n=1 Tax=Volvox reticuliferus TaxID=1737510 RepID=A0A8J4CXQ3_9CHLO|nr:hypothetical protein Vretifemale_18756 [Volvox reticuliferus]GIM05034.1 hypothetical protein Vretimale_9498 [Volvox reticuliferus]
MIRSASLPCGVQPSCITCKTPGFRSTASPSFLGASRNAAATTTPASSRSSTISPHTLTSADNVRLNLWLSLLQASVAQFAAATTYTAATATEAALRLQRLSQPRPLNFPPGPPGDQTLALLSDPLSFLSSTTKQYGQLVGLTLGGEHVVLVTGREAARVVLLDQAGSVYVKEGTAFFPGSSLAGNGLLVSDGALWQRQRRLSNPAFRRTAVEAYSGAMVAATRNMLDMQWGSGGSRDVYADFNELTLRVTLKALFGFGAGEQQSPSISPSSPTAHIAPSPSSSTSSEEAQQIVAAVEKAFMFFTQRAATGFVIPEWFPTWDNLEFAAAVQQLDRVVYGMIKRRREELAAVHGSIEAAAVAATSAAAASALPSDLLTSLLLSRDEDGSGMSDQALRDELMTLLVAGQETSAILLGWAAALLAAHPEVQERAAAEVTEVCGRDAPPTATSVRHMPHLESVVLETLRLYSPAYMVGRCARVDAALGPYSLPSGTTVLVSPYVMHRDAAVWANPDAFLPERWRELQDREGYQGYMSLMSNLGPNGAYLPFGGGPRNCIGTGFAMMEAMLVLGAVLQRCRLTLPLSEPQSRPGPVRGAAEATSGLPASFPKAKPLLTLRPESVVLRITPR